MNNLLNSKLYVKYYPLETESDKKRLLEFDYLEIFKKIKIISSISRNELDVRKNEYISRMKPTKSFLGVPKYGNISNNRYLAQKLMTDRNIKKLEEQIQDLDSLALKFSYNLIDDITIEELNYALSLMNKDRHKSIFCAVSILVLGIVLCMFVIL